MKSAPCERRLRDGFSEGRNLNPDVHAVIDRDYRRMILGGDWQGGDGDQPRAGAADCRKTLRWPRAGNEDRMTGPEHYAAAEQLLEHAEVMLDTEAGPGHRTELVARQAATATMACAHAVLAAAAAAGLSAHLDPLDTGAWRDVAATPFTAPGTCPRRRTNRAAG